MRTRLLIILLLLGTISQAQNWEEWTQQKKTQQKYLLQQIGALQVSIGYAREGYSIAKKGLAAIGKIKKGDFDLHNEKVASLKRVNPTISSSSKVAAMISRQLKIVKESKKTIQAVNEDSRFTATEKEYCKAVFTMLLSCCAVLLDELHSITMFAEFRMTDDERIKRIEALYQETQSQYAFCASFSTKMGMLSLQRASEQVEIDYSKKIKGGL